MTNREHQAQQTYEHILHTAETLLQNTTYEKLSVNDICIHAGISKGGFYHHFSSKDQLIALLIGRKLEQTIYQRVMPLLGKEDAITLLRLNLQTGIDFLRENPKDTFARCWLAIAEYDESSSPLFSCIFYDLLYQIILQGKEEGVIRNDIDTDFCKQFLTAVYSGIILHALSCETSADTFIQQSLDVIHQVITV